MLADAHSLECVRSKIKILQCQTKTAEEKAAMLNTDLYSAVLAREEAESLAASMGKQMDVTRAELSRAERDRLTMLEQLSNTEKQACEYKTALRELNEQVMCGEQTIEEQYSQLKRACDLVTKTETQLKEAQRVLWILEGDVSKSNERACCLEQSVVELQKQVKKLKEEMVLMFRNEEMLLHSEKMYEQELKCTQERLHDMELSKESAEMQVRKLEKIVHQLQDKLTQAECVKVDLQSENAYILCELKRCL